MQRIASGGVVLGFVVLAVGCSDPGTAKKDGGKPGEPPADRLVGVLDKYDLNNMKLVLLVDGKATEHPLAEKVTFYSDPETQSTNSGLPDFWFGELVVVTREKRDGRDVVVSLRPPTKDQLPPDPPGTKVAGKFVGWSAKKYPDDKIFLDVDGKKQEYPAAEKTTWYDVHGSKIKRDQTRAFLNVPVTVLLVKKGDREEAAIIRAAK